MECRSGILSGSSLFARDTNNHLGLMYIFIWKFKYVTAWAHCITPDNKIEPRHEISNNVVCATSKTSDQPAHTRSLIRTFASRLNSLLVLSC